MKHLLTVIVVLLAFACCTTEADRNRMRAELDSINQRNRNDQPFTAADVQSYIDFFDDFFALVICGSLLFTDT
jgi:hypothetical protein